jgi:CBS domain-containing protein
MNDARREAKEGAMTVDHVMKRDLVACRPSDDLAAAAALMERQHCGWLPVVDAHGTVIGVMTDRDACLHAAAANRPMARVSVQEAMSSPVYSAIGSDTVEAALATMAAHHVRRLPVIDAHGLLEGVVSIDDIARVTDRHGAPTARAFVDAFDRIAARPAIEATHALP